MSRSGEEVVGGDVGDFVRMEAGEVAGKARGITGDIEDPRDLTSENFIDEFRGESGARGIHDEEIRCGQVAKVVFTFPEEKTGVFAGYAGTIGREDHCLPSRDDGRSVAEEF